MKHQQVTPHYKLPVSEMFLSIQGEPQSVGRPAFFIRFEGCNLKCKWCDTKYSWSIKNYVPIEKIIKEIKKHKQYLIVFTGGEPLIWKDVIFRIVKENPKIDFEIETNGTIGGQEFSNLNYNISPKLSSSGNTKINYDFLKSFGKFKKSIFKFVVCNDKDWNEAIRLVIKYKLPKEKIYIMPEGVEWKKYRQHCLELVDKVIKANYKLAVRFQILLWGKKKLK